MFSTIFRNIHTQKVTKAQIHTPRNHLISFPFRSFRFNAYSNYLQSVDLFLLFCAFFPVSLTGTKTIYLLLFICVDILCVGIHTHMLGLHTMHFIQLTLTDFVIVALLHSHLLLLLFFSRSCYFVVYKTVMNGEFAYILFLPIS